MKSDELQKVLADFDVLLGDSACAQLPAMSAFHEILQIAGAKQLKSTLTRLRNADFGGNSRSGETLGDCQSRLAAFAAFAAAHMKRSAADDLKQLTEFVQEHRDVSVVDFVSVARVALAEAPRKSTRQTCQSAEIVSSYAKKLDETFGFEPDFDEVFETLKSDPKMKAAELKKLAKQFTKLAAKSREDALRKIYNRHTSVLNADLHRRATGGRIAG